MQKMSRLKTLAADLLLILETEQYELVLVSLTHPGIVCGTIKLLRGLLLLMLLLL
jgi:hypothetical protein